MDHISVITALRDAKTAAPVPFTGLAVKTAVSPSHSVTTLVQRYKNVEEKAIEAVYTFPLPEGAVILSVKARIGKDELEAKVKPQEKASKQYEEAIEGGHTALLVEHASNGLYTLNLGNLLPGEDAEIIAVYADENRWEGGKMRWRLPLTVAPKYGKSNLQPHQEPKTDLNVRYDASLEMTIDPELAKAKVTSESHKISIAKAKAGIAIAMKRGDFAMDRDLVIDIDAVEVISAARMAKSKNGSAIVASFIPKGDWIDENKSRNFKIVLDCSGSMGGDAMGSARKALEYVIGELNEADFFNIIRFGSNFELMFPSQVQATRQNLRLAEDCVRLIDANMGGTEMPTALRACYESTTPEMAGGDVILITDGQVYSEAEMLAAAKASGHRIFTVGVGSSVSMSLLRSLASETGGAAEFVVPGEGVSRAIINQFRRIRSGFASNIKVYWPGDPINSLNAPKTVFAGDALHVAAFYDKLPKGKIELSFTTEDGEKRTELIDLATSATTNGDAAWNDVRIAASMRLKQLTADAKQSSAEKLAIDYELISPWTSLVVVRKNAKKDRPEEMPELRQVPQMAPAGWAMLNAPQAQAFAMSAMAAGPSVMRSRGFSLNAAPMFGSSASLGSDSFDVAAGAVQDFADLTFGSQTIEDPTEVYGSLGRPRSGGRRLLKARAAAPEKPRLLTLVSPKFGAMLEAALLGAKEVTTIDQLKAIGLSEDVVQRLRELVGNHPEWKLVQAFICTVLATCKLSMAGKVVANRLKAMADQQISRLIQIS